MKRRASLRGLAAALGMLLAQPPIGPPVRAAALDEHPATSAPC
jgi:hypothetical protein